MNLLTYRKISRKPALGVLGAIALGLLSACNGDTAAPPDENDGIFEGSGAFQIRSSNTDLVLLEGDPNGLRIPLSLTRNNGHSSPVQLEVRGRTEEDVAFVTSSFSNLTLTPSEDESEAVLKLSIADAPIKPQQREFIIVADDGNDNTDAIPISVSVQPTSAPDVYLLAGQSNMIGFSGDGTRQSEPGGADEPNDRIKQLNVSRNDSSLFRTAADFRSPTKNVVPPGIVTALDPLHLPQDPDNGNGKDLQYIGLGLSFAKTALEDTTAEIILVPAAWSGSSFCANSNGPGGNWMPVSSSNQNLGNTLLFDRAVARANLALQESGGVFRGILWHQGESDANDRCASVYQENMRLMMEQMRRQILPVGNEALRRVNATIPFVVGTMSRGFDEREDLSVFLPAKQMIDDAHKSFPDIIYSDGTPVYAALSNHDDLIPSNGYPCGNDTCIHFGPEALREMGRRYYQALLRALPR